MHALLLAILPAVLASGLVPRQDPTDSFPEATNPKSTSTSTSSSSSVSASAVIEFFAPQSTPNVCSNATFKWGWRVLNPGSTLFTLQIASAPGPATTAQAAIPGITTATPTTPPTSGVTPGSGRKKRAADDGDGTPDTVSSSLVVAQGVFSWPNVTVPSGWYVLTGTTDPTTPAGVAFVASSPFFIANGTSSACLAHASTSSLSTSMSTSSTGATASATETPITVSARRKNAGIITGAVLGGFILGALVLAGLWMLRSRRARERASWRDERAKQWTAFAQHPSSTAVHHEVEGKEDPHDGPKQREHDEAAAAELRRMLRESGIQAQVEASRAPPARLDASAP